MNMKNTEFYIPNPIVIEDTPQGEKQYDIYSRLMIDRIIFLGTDLTNEAANLLIAQMLYLEQTDTESPIHLYINSSQGQLYSALGVYDIMNYISCPIHTYCVGITSSISTLLLVAGEAGHRQALPHSKIMIHQPLGGIQGQCTDIQIMANEIQNLKSQINNIYSSHTKKSLAEIEIATNRDNFFNPNDAIKFGLIDSIIEKVKK